jgi:hypothetical protein
VGYWRETSSSGSDEEFVTSIPDVNIKRPLTKKRRPTLRNSNSERKEMYLDAIYENQEVIFNGSPDQAVKFLMATEEHIRQYYWIIRGESLEGYTCNDYLKWMRAI